MSDEYLDPDLDNEKQLENLDVVNAIGAEASAFEMCLDIGANDFVKWLVGEIESPIDYPAQLTPWVAKVQEAEFGFLIKASWLDFWGMWGAGLEPESDEVSALHEEHPDYVFGARLAGPGRTIFWGKCYCMAFEKPGDGRYWHIAAKAFQLFGRATPSIVRCPAPLRDVLDGKAETCTYGVNPLSLVCYLEKRPEIPSEDAHERAGSKSKGPTEETAPSLGSPSRRLGLQVQAWDLFGWCTAWLERWLDKDYRSPDRLRCEMRNSESVIALAGYSENQGWTDADTDYVLLQLEETQTGVWVQPTFCDPYRNGWAARLFGNLIQALRSEFLEMASPVPPPAPQPAEKPVGGPSPTVRAEAATEQPMSESGPWGVIADEREREMVRLWCENMTNSEIADELHRLGLTKERLVPITITKRLSDLRVLYGHEVVPLDKERRVSRKLG